MATAVCEVIKKKNPDSNLIVVSGYPDVFLNNPYVDRAFAFGQASYFYEEHIEGKEFLIHAHNPYVETNHVKSDEHLIKTWCEMFGYEYDGELPKIYLTSRETTFYSQKYLSDKPILLLQTNGGAPNQELKYSWARDIPQHVAQEVVDHFKKDYTVVHIRRDDQFELKDTTQVSDNFRSLCVLIMASSKRLLIDSFAQHAAVAFNLPSVVCWIANKKEVFGYDLHTNIEANPFTKKAELRYSYFGKFNIIGDPLEFPYNHEYEIFNTEDIISALENN